MLLNVLIGLGVMVFCLFVQALLVAAAAHFYVRHRALAMSSSFMQTLAIIGGVMLVLVVGNFFQISIWALLFQYLGEFDTFMEAAYHSGVNFATLGYGDIVMSAKHRILGPIEAVNGVLMIGVSTAVMMSALQDALRRTYEARQKGDG